MASHPLIGTWKLDSIQFVDADTGERLDIYGPEPRGTYMIGEDGHAMVLITDGTLAHQKGNEDVAPLFNGMMSYYGPYELADDGRVIIHIETAWHPDWVGTDQERFFKIEGNKLAITSPVQVHPKYPGRRGHGVIMWHRADGTSA
jgi:Lipocalin-like domain